MQYLLTKDEWDSLVPKKMLEEAESKIDKLNDLVLEKSGLVCVRVRGGYCDFCPITFSCKKYKQFSK